MHENCYCGYWWELCSFCIQILNNVIFSRQRHEDETNVIGFVQIKDTSVSYSNICIFSVCASQCTIHIHMPNYRITATFVYWGLSLFSVTLSKDRYTGYFLSGLIEIPAGIIGPLLLSWLVFELTDIYINLFSVLVEKLSASFHMHYPVVHYWR